MYSPQTLCFGYVFFSINNTFFLSLDKCIALVKPANPPPTIITSKVVVLFNFIWLQNILLEFLHY